MSTENNNYFNSEMFGSDDEVNYGNFLRIDSKINPSTSTQLPTSQKKFAFDSYDQENRTPIALQVNTPSTSTPPTISDVMKTMSEVIKTQREHGTIIRVLLREVKLLRRELKEDRQNSAKEPVQSSLSIMLNIPAVSADEFKKLEDDIKVDPEKQKILINLFDKMMDQNMDKFIKGCLKLIITIRAATSFTWYGRHGNSPVEGYKLISLIIDCAGKKFPTSKIAERVSIIKKWYQNQYAKDVHKKNLDLEAKTQY